MKLLRVMLCSAATLAMATTAMAEEPDMKGPGAPQGMMEKDGMHHKMKREHDWPKTRQEAIEKTKERLKELEGMTDEDWNKRKEMRMERREEWKEKRKEWKEKRMDGKAPEGTIPEPKTDKQ